MSAWKPGPILPPKPGTVWDNVTVTSHEPAMPWGKHKNVPLRQVPRDYLEWAVHNAEILKPDLRREMEAILGLPIGSTGPPPGKPGDVKLNDVKADESLSDGEKAVIRGLKAGWAKDQARVKELERENQEIRAQLSLSRRDKPTDLDVFRRILKQVFAALSRKHHPDLGGSPNEQVIVNDFYKALIARLETETCNATSNGCK